MAMAMANGKRQRQRKRWKKNGRKCDIPKEENTKVQLHFRYVVNADCRRNSHRIAWIPIVTLFALSFTDVLLLVGLGTQRAKVFVSSVTDLIMSELIIMQNVLASHRKRNDFFCSLTIVAHHRQRIEKTLHLNRFIGHYNSASASMWRKFIVFGMLSTPLAPLASQSTIPNCWQNCISACVGDGIEDIVSQMALEILICMCV